MNWQSHAAELAEGVTLPVSRWHPIIAAVPRHMFVPRWWTWSARGSRLGAEVWQLRDGPADVREWLRAAYSDRSLVTQIGPLHADHAALDDRPDGRPTSSSTLPRLVVQMFRHAQLFDGADVLDVGTGSGYGCALLARRFGDGHVTSVDVDPYLTKAASERLDSIGLHPQVITSDATSYLPGTYDRIVAMVSVKPIPRSWMTALRPGGRLVTTIAGTTAIVTATKGRDGWARGRVEWERAGFMHARSGSDYPPGLHDLYTVVKDQEGEEVTRGRYPVIRVEDSWELESVLEIAAPGIVHHYEESDGDCRTAWMLHEDGSWARATAHGTEAPTVHQGGSRRLWDILDELRDYWLSRGYFQLYGAKVSIPPEGGKVYLSRGKWEATIT